MVGVPPPMLSALRSAHPSRVRQAGPGTRNPALTPVLPEFGFDLETWVGAHEDLRQVRLVLDTLLEGVSAYAGGVVS